MRGKPERTQSTHDADLDRIARRLDGILWHLGRLLSTMDAGFRHLTQEIRAMAGELDNVAREVEEITTVTQSTITLLGQLGDLIRSLKNDPARLQQLADQLDTQGNQLAAAVAANTPAAEEPGPITPE